MVSLITRLFGSRGRDALDKKSLIVGGGAVGTHVLPLQLAIGGTYSDAKNDGFPVRIGHQISGIT